MPEEREDVEAKPQQSTTPDISQQKRKWRSIDWIAGGTFIAEVLWGSWWLVTQVFHWCSWNPRISTEHFAQFYCGVGLGILSVGYLVLILWPTIFKQGKDSKQDNDPRWFHARILSSGIVGGSYAFLLPAVMSLEERGLNSGGAAALRQAILLATGGLIGLIALGETRRKNDNDLKAANELQIRHKETLYQQEKQFNEQLEEQQKQFNASAFKERKAERRERYTKAVEQLGDEKAPIRMGGVYTLVGLVDEWLEEENLSKPERAKEGQVIINNLCAYIRSPFTLASHYGELSQDTPTTEVIYKDSQQKSHKKWQIISSNLYACIRSRFTPDSRHDELSQDSYTAFYKDREQEFYADKATLESEADVRLGIIKEIHNRLQGSEENTPGTWSDFEYDFSGSTFFYPVDLTKSYYKKPVNFSGSTYEGWADFTGSTYEGWADFSRSTYEGWADFTGSTYEGWADFSRSTYQNLADFSGSTYQGSMAGFSRFTYKGGADFSGSSYKGGADFSGSSYKGRADFSGSSYKGGACFYHSSYKDGANFHSSTYQIEVYFSDSTYQGEVYFHSSTYQGEADFSRSIFYSETYFGKDKYSNSFSCFTNRAPQFYDKKNRKNTLFGSHNNDFTVDIDKGYPINLDSEGLPLGCKFITSEQKEYLADKFQEIEKINNELREIKDPKEKAELSRKLQALNKELYEWWEEATTVKVEGTALGEDDN